MEYLLDESGCQKLVYFLAKSLEFGWMTWECSATSLGMPGISEGLHAKMLALARRKSTSTTSYLLSRVAMIFSALPSGGL